MEEIKKLNEELARYREIAFEQSDIIESLKRQNAKLSAQIESMKEYPNEDILVELTSVLDDIYRASVYLTRTSENSGVFNIFNKFQNILENFGLNRFESSDYEEFDDNKHNAVSLIRDERMPHAYVAEVYKDGYRYKDKIIRYADVIVNKLK